MNVGRRRIVDAIFEEALDLPPDAQAALLDKRCGADAALRHDVMELLRLSRVAAPDFAVPSEEFRQAAMQSSGHAPAPTPAGGANTRDTRDTRDPITEAGERIGGWRVIREIGRGGMGSVYLVERAGVEFAQRGALKLVEGSGRAEDVHRRLERERRILASLSHPHIAQLLDGGRAPDGRPFLVMEYVEGRHIDRFCDEERLTIDERLDLFSHVCAALQQAHRQLVVHRDVKPSNIIVTADRHPILLDFGIARLLSADQEHDGAATGPAARILTPDYASPEQVRGEPVAIASDVYQLGLLLYELLTGAQAQSLGGPARKTRPRTLEQAICESEPIRPSVRVLTATHKTCNARRTTPRALSRALKGDLDSVILCALRKEPERRYGSVADLLDDLDRYRRGAPLRAGAESLTYRARKFMTRHRIGVAWASAGMIAAIALLVIVGGARMRAAREAAEARQMERLLAELFTVPNRALTGRPPATLDYVRQAVELTRRQLAGQPESQARLLTLLGQTATNLGNYELSNDVLSQALALRISTTGADSVETADALTVLAQGQHYLGRYDDAEASLRRALSIRSQRFGPGHAQTIETTLNLGDLLHTRGNLTAAETLLRGAVDHLRKRPEPPEQPRPLDQAEQAAPSRQTALGRLDDLDQLARALRDFGNVLRDRGLLEESEKCYREAVDLLTRRHGVNHVAVAETNTYFGRLLVRRGKFEEADARLEHSLSSLRRSFEGDHPLTGTALRELGLLRIRQERFAEAERVLADAQEVFKVWVGEDHPMVPRARAHQAELAFRRGDHAEAVRLARLTLDQFRRLRLDDHPSAIDARLTLGQALLSSGRTADAERELAAGLMRARRHLSDEDPRIGEFRIGLAEAARRGRASVGAGAGATSAQTDRSGAA